MTKQTLEVVEFALNDGVTDDAFLAEVENTKAFIASLEGFIERSTGKNDNEIWIDVVKWSDMKSAKEAAVQFGSSEEVKSFVMMINHESIKMQHFEVEATM